MSPVLAFNDFLLKPVAIMTRSSSSWMTYPFGDFVLMIGVKGDILNAWLTGHHDDEPMGRGLQEIVLGKWKGEIV